METRPHRPRLAEAVAIASGWSVADSANMLARDGQGEWILIYEYGIDSVRPGVLERTNILNFPSPHANVLWSRLVANGLAPGASEERSFACRTCSGTGQMLIDTPDGGRGHVDCDECKGKLVFGYPARITDALAFAGDADRIVAFEKRVRRGRAIEITWRLTYGNPRVEPDEAMKGPHYRTEKKQPDANRVWALIPEL